jgi:Flp pilus assembly protein TadD
VRATEHAIQLKPDDAGLYANLALAHVISGRDAEAQTAIRTSLGMAHDDRISQSVQRLVEDVLSGKRRRPQNMGDL